MAKNILIGITGGIAAYKIPLLVRLLKKQGHQVRIVMSAHAGEFVTATTLQAVSGEKVRSDLADSDAELGMSHIELARWADIFLIAPATANTIAKLAHGIADNLLTTLYLATSAHILIAPAMNKNMYAHPAVADNLHILRHRAHHTVIMPESGSQACGDNGVGRLPEPETLLSYLTAATVGQDLAGQCITVTAGPTREAIDPVRYLSNHSSGKMGYALARAALRRGATVNLISGPVALTPPAGIHLYPVVSALDMYDAALKLAVQSDIFIAAAAVADYRPVFVADRKLKKQVDDVYCIQLTENPDIVAAVAALKENRPFTVGFAAETHQVIDYARRKCRQKRLDLIIANDVSQEVFGSDDNEVIILGTQYEEHLPRQDKTQLADILLSRISAARQRLKRC